MEIEEDVQLMGAEASVYKGQSSSPKIMFFFGETSPRGGVLYDPKKIISDF